MILHGQEVAESHDHTHSVGIQQIEEEYMIIWI